MDVESHKNNLNSSENNEDDEFGDFESVPPQFTDGGFGDFLIPTMKNQVNNIQPQFLPSFSSYPQKSDNENSVDDEWGDFVQINSAESNNVNFNNNGSILFEGIGHNFVGSSSFKENVKNNDFDPFGNVISRDITNEIVFKETQSVNSGKDGDFSSNKESNGVRDVSKPLPLSLFGDDDLDEGNDGNTPNFNGNIQSLDGNIQILDGNTKMEILSNGVEKNSHKVQLNDLIASLYQEAHTDSSPGTGQSPDVVINGINKRLDYSLSDSKRDGIGLQKESDGDTWEWDFKDASIDDNAGESTSNSNIESGSLDDQPNGDGGLDVFAGMVTSSKPELSLLFGNARGEQELSSVFGNEDLKGKQEFSTVFGNVDSNGKQEFNTVFGNADTDSKQESSSEFGNEGLTGEQGFLAAFGYADSNGKQDFSIAFRNEDSNSKQEFTTMFGNKDWNGKQDFSSVFGNADLNGKQVVSTIYGNADSNGQQEFTTVSGSENSKGKQKFPTVFGNVDSNVDQVFSSVFGNADSNGKQEFSSVFGNADLNGKQEFSTAFRNLNLNSQQEFTTVFGNAALNNKQEFSKVFENKEENDYSSSEFKDAVMELRGENARSHPLMESFIDVSSGGTEQVGKAANEMFDNLFANGEEEDYSSWEFKDADASIPYAESVEKVNENGSHNVAEVSSNRQDTFDDLFGIEDEEDYSSWEFKDVGADLNKGRATGIPNAESIAVTEQGSNGTGANMIVQEMFDNLFANEEDDDFSWEFKDALSEPLNTGSPNDNQVKEQDMLDRLDKCSYSTEDVDKVLEFYRALKEESFSLSLLHLATLEESLASAKESDNDEEIELINKNVQEAKKKLGVTEIKRPSKRNSVEEMLPSHQNSLMQLFESAYNLSEFISRATDDLKAATDLYVHSLSMITLISTPIKDQVAYLSTWFSTASVCAAELQNGLKIWNQAMKASVQAEILSQPKGKKYYSALMEIFRVSEVLRISADFYKPWMLLNPDKAQKFSLNLEKCAAAWIELGVKNALSDFNFDQSGSFTELKNVMDLCIKHIHISNLMFKATQDNEEFCAISLLPASFFSGLKTVNWMGRFYFLPLANLWVNCVNIELPQLPVVAFKF